MPSAHTNSQGSTLTAPGNTTPKGYQQITSVSAAVGCTVPANSKVALIQAETQAVRWRDDGTNPTATVGSIIAAGDTIQYTGDLAAIKFIETTTSAKLNISYYG